MGMVTMYRCGIFLAAASLLLCSFLNVLSVFIHLLHSLFDVLRSTAVKQTQRTMVKILRLFHS